MGRVAFAYYRKTGGEVDTIREATITSCTREHGITVAATETDPPAICLTASGTNFSRMLTRMHAGEADTLVIDQLCSLSEDMIEQELVLSHLRRWGINVLCVCDPELSANDPERRLLREFGNRNELTKRMEGLRLQGVRIAARQRTGKSEGAKRYGERAGEEVVMNQIRDMRHNGIGNTGISRLLNEQNIPPRRGKKWLPTTIANILDARRNAAKRKATRDTKKPTR